MNWHTSRLFENPTRSEAWSMLWDGVGAEKQNLGHKRDFMRTPGPPLTCVFCVGVQDSSDTTASQLPPA
jgi:hypothetical protein